MEKIITKITKNKIYFNDGEILDINPDIIYYYKLKKDMNISEIYNDVLFDSIKQKSFFYLYLKSRTKYELKSKLKEKYKNVDMIEEVLNNLEDEAYIDDVDYATSYILTHKNSRQKNTMKLLQKGISKKNIDLAYEDVPREIEIETLENEVFKLKEKGTEKSQIILKLMRKGYEYDKIKNIIEMHTK